MRFGSLFAGIGGLDLGLERAGMECAWQVEIDDFCQQVLAKHWPDVPKHGDIRNVGKQNLETVALICGGFPCQPFSVAGKQRGTEDDRHLWPEMLRVIAELKPAWVIGENVPGIIPLFLDTAVSDLENQDYTCETFVLPAVAFDARHRRDRLFVIAYRNDIGHLFIEPEKQPAVTGINAQRHPSAIREDVADTSKEGLQIRKGQTGKSRQAGIRLEQEDVPERRWLPEPSVGRVVNGVSTRLDGHIRRLGYENADDKKTIAKVDEFRREVLRTLWEREQPSAPPRKEKSEFHNYIVSDMPYEIAYERWYLGQRIEKDEELHDLWQRILPQPFQETQDLQQRMFERIRKKERGETLVQNRVARLKALGNAVVPQVAEHIGRMIMEVVYGYDN